MNSNEKPLIRKIGSFLKRVRKKKNKNCTEIIHSLGLGMQVYQWEKGYRCVPYNYIDAVKKAYEMTEEESKEFVEMMNSPGLRKHYSRTRVDMSSFSISPVMKLLQQVMLLSKEDREKVINAVRALDS